jgi:hypothetical protein
VKQQHPETSRIIIENIFWQLSAGGGKRGADWRTAHEDLSISDSEIAVFR